MKKLSAFLAAVLCIAVSNNLQAQISGKVFKDFNFNGTQQTTGAIIEPGVYGIQVKAFNATGLQLGTTKITPDTSGSFSFSAAEIPAGTNVRIEFTTPFGTYEAKTAAGGSGSSVQFVTAPSTTTNYAISSQDWYSSTANPYVATNAATNGNPNGGGTAGTNDNLHIFPYDMGNGTADDGGTTRRLANSQLGSVYGLAFQKPTRTLFMSAYLKRHVGFGPNGIGAIYKSTISATGVPGAATLLVNVSAIGINVGTDPRTVTLPAASNTQNADIGVFAQVGKRGIGGMDISQDGNSIYFVNMFQKRLHRINVGKPVKTTFTAADATGNWLIPDPATPGTVWHPMACKSANGKIYIGGVVVRETSATHNLAADTVGARGIVYEFDTATAVFTEILRFPFNYRRGFSNNDFRYPTKANWWCAWQNNGNGGAADPIQADYNTSNGAFTGGVYYPQPMIAGLEFDVNGEIIIGIRDRFGDQIGYQNVSDDGLPTGTGFGAANNFFRGLSSGEVLRAGKNIGSNSYSLESLGTVTSNGVSITTAGVPSGNPAVSGNWSPTASGTPWGGTYGPGWIDTLVTIPGGGPSPGKKGAYYYFNQNFTTTGTPGTLNSTAGGAIAAHFFKTDGSVALLPGTGEMILTMMDPVTTSYAQGAGKLSNITGNMNQRLQLTVTTTGTPGDPTNMGKAGGMCDLELLTDYQPIEVGNRVWNDANENGIQDPGESGISGVTVQITGPGVDGLLGTADDVVLGTTTTSANGEYNFSSLTTADSRRPAAFIGVGVNDILPGFAYQIRINPSQTALVGYHLSVTDASANTKDLIDNDGALINGFVAVNFNTSGTIHSFDFGLKLPALGDRVWLDNGSGGGTANDGLQNGTEPGVAGVGVMLYKNGTDGLPGTSDDVLTGATVTDAYGNYLFDNLAATDQTNATTISRTSYNVRFTRPANYSFSTQTNTTDVTTGTYLTGSDVNALGTSYSINLTAVNLNIDAGLIFTTPAALSSIGDKVWFDSNSNNNYEITEPGVSGITVTLYDNATGNILAVTTTDANGNYLFNNLPIGTYIVGFSKPGGTIFGTSAGTTPGNATTNSDPDPSTGRTTVITISANGTVITGIDAGLRNDINSALGDFIWNDLNRNGIQDAGEPGIPGITVQLYNPGANNIIGGGDDILLSTTVTDANGYYIFTGLAAGRYFVAGAHPAGYTLTLKDVTAANPGLDTKDNDFSTGTGTYAGRNVSPVIIITSGSGVTRDLTIDMGVYSTLTTLHSIGDFVWNDINKNGIQDGGSEIGIPNVTVRVYNGSGIAVNNPATGQPYVVSTDANGAYKFADLPDGTYIVEFANLPAGYNFINIDAVGSGAPGSGTDGTTDSDVKRTTGTTAVITLAGVNITNVDAGLAQGIDAGTASIGNRVWYDLNGDGLQTAGELGVAGVRAELLDAAGASIDYDAVTAGVQPTVVYTNALGEYSFTNIAAGDYQVKFSNFPANYKSAAANLGTNDDIDQDAAFTGVAVTATTTATTATYTLAQGQDDLSVDMGIIPPLTGAINTIGDFVWNDLNSDGIQTAGEPGVSGVNVSLYTNGADGLPSTADDVLVAVTATDSLGRYAFVGLADGNYNVGFSNLPAGFRFSEQNISGSTAANGSDANTATGRTGTIALDPASASAAEVINNDIDAGVISTRAALGDYVWADTNGDGIQDAAEKGIPGVTVILYANDGTTVLASTVTDANGKYYFGNLIPGTFVVGFGTVPASLSFTVQNTPGDNGNNTNSDADVTTGKTAVITLIAGEREFTIDAGLRPDNFASVGDFVWNDVNSNGAQNANEPGVPGIIVTLYDAANTVIGTAITDGNGKYLISKVPAGTGYYVIFSNLPASSTFTTQNSNVTPGDATLGSDANATTGRTASFNLTAGQYLPTVDAGILSISLVPAHALTFTAVADKESVRLNWSMQTQQDVVRYNVEFSSDNRNYSGIAAVAGTGTDVASYEAFHLSPVEGVNYYRLKLTTNTGAISYSDIRKVVFSKKSEMAVFPNPAKEKVNITVSGGMIGKAATITLYSTRGELVSVQSFASLGQKETTDVSRLASGTYILRITSETEAISKTIQVVR